MMTGKMTVGTGWLLATQLGSLDLRSLTYGALYGLSLWESFATMKGLEYLIQVQLYTELRWSEIYKL